MANGKPINGARGYTTLLASIIASLGGSGTGVYVYMKNITPQQLQATARPDPATGTELREVKGELRTHLLNHPDRELDRRLNKLEANQQVILQEIQEIKKDLHR